MIPKYEGFNQNVYSKSNKDKWQNHTSYTMYFRLEDDSHGEMQLYTKQQSLR